jgi:hypothetical protein
LAQALKFCHDGKRHLTCDEASASLHCSNKENSSADQTPEATLGRSQILRIMGKLKWLLVNVCEYKGLISVMTGFLNQCQ